jgi:hypothetical protein
VPEFDYNVTTVGADISRRWQTPVESRVTLSPYTTYTSGRG